MRRIIFPMSLFILSLSFLTFTAKAQETGENLFKNLEIITTLQRSPQAKQTPRSSNIKNIQTFGEKSGIALTDDALFKTDDNGENWREVNLPKNFNQQISTVFFENENAGSAILADRQNARLEFIKTNDGGNSWTKTPIELRNSDLLEADLNNVSLERGVGGDLVLLLRAPTSSNFVGQIVYQSSNDGQTWNFSRRTVEIRRTDEATAEKISGDWTLKTEGICEGAKVGCLQETKIFAGNREITSPQIKELARIETDKARIEAQNSIFSRPPNGSTRISLNRGFDKCTAAPVAQMQSWWNASPFYDSNIYISGRNRGCTQAQLTAAWVNSVSAMGWGLIPTIVGYQASCSVCTSCQKHSSDAAVAETQGRGEADIAMTDANNLGLTQGTVLYYDMERYDETVATPGCRVAVNSFLKGWTDRLHEQNYISGVYGSPFNANGDWINIPLPSRMDAVWLARWNNIMSVYGVAPLPDTYWTNHQRIHQWLGPRDENWGGVTFNIDNNISDAPVAGLRIPKNKPADFDGDGKTDVSVYRPDAGNWFVLNSSNASFNAVAFGNSTDVLAPGDYDGDGKTDTAVFRPSEGSWYFRTKAGFVSSRQFGTSGDIPVPADYNGDGKTDVAVFRPSNGTWYIANSDSLGTFTFVQFGQTGDKPVLGDYDGDGKTDLAVFRPATGSWFILRSSDGGFNGVNFGISTDQPIPGDYDGDNKTDVAVFRSGVWYLLQTTAGFSGVQFGASGDMPAVGDYDGDNKTDLAVYRPANGTWYQLQSQNGFGATAFGISTDKPIPNAYLPQ